MKKRAREALGKLGLLRPLYRLKSRLTGERNLEEKVREFYTLSPPLLVALQWCLREGHSRGILDETEYMEFGIFRGFAFWYAQAVAVDLGLRGMRFFGFDSFAGLPEIEDKDAKEDFKKGQFAASKALVEQSLNLYGVDWERTFLVPDYFSDSLTADLKARHQMRKCSICVVDCDLYEATRDALNFVGPIFNEKAFVVFDDWNCYDADPDKGERKAFAEFLAKNPAFKATPAKQFGWNCQVFLLETTPG